MTTNIRADFPILGKKRADGKPLVYFDNAATTQKPRQVIDAIKNYYENYNANVHRGIYDLSEKSTEIYEEARVKVAKFINAGSEKEIIFVRNTTEAINLVALSWGKKNILPGDEVVTTIVEHHSNFLPWKQLAKDKKAILKIAGIDQDINTLVTKKNRIIAQTQASNVIGTINPVEKIRRSSDKAIVVVDAAQAVAHFDVDVQKLGCDFYAFSAHKMFGPMGIGVLWGRREILEEMPPFLWGGGMVSLDLPEKFEAGTPNVAGAVGLSTAIDYLDSIGWQAIKKHEDALTNKLLYGLAKIKKITIYGPKTKGVPVISFNVIGIHPHDGAQFLADRYNICLRAGNHCAAPLHQKLGIPASIRASLAFYNTEEEVDIFISAIKDLIKTFR